MNLFLVTVIASFVVATFSQDEDSSQQVVVSCPARPNVARGTPGVPGKRGTRGEIGAPGGYKFVCCLGN